MVFNLFCNGNVFAFMYRCVPVCVSVCVLACGFRVSGFYERTLIMFNLSRMHIVSTCIFSLPPPRLIPVPLAFTHSPFIVHTCMYRSCAAHVFPGFQRDGERASVLVFKAGSQTPQHTQHHTPNTGNPGFGGTGERQLALELWRRCERRGKEC